MRDRDDDAQRPAEMPAPEVPAEDDEGDGFSPFGSGPVPIGPRGLVHL